LTIPNLYIFSGLPGTGKTTLSQALAKQITAVHLRVDTVEQALKDVCAINVQGEGYRLSYRIAADNLRLGISVVADSCNPIELTRNEWETVALESGAGYVNIEVVCSDKLEHRNRVENRFSTVPGPGLPTWKDVESREYQLWSKERIIIDTSGKSVNECLDGLLSSLLDMHAYQIVRPDLRLP
jgi:predicted kinase